MGYPSACQMLIYKHDLGQKYAFLPQIVLIQGKGNEAQIKQRLLDRQVAVHLAVHPCDCPPFSIIT